MIGKCELSTIEKSLWRNRKLVDAVFSLSRIWTIDPILTVGSDDDSEYNWYITLEDFDEQEIQVIQKLEKIIMCKKEKAQEYNWESVREQGGF